MKKYQYLNTLLADKNNRLVKQLRSVQDDEYLITNVDHRTGLTYKEKKRTRRLEIDRMN